MLMHSLPLRIGLRGGRRIEIWVQQEGFTLHPAWVIFVVQFSNVKQHTEVHCHKVRDTQIPLCYVHAHTHAICLES